MKKINTTPTGREKYSNREDGAIKKIEKIVSKEDRLERREGQQRGGGGATSEEKSLEHIEVY